jgi:uncharacterized protein (TIGR03067 family)
MNKIRFAAFAALLVALPVALADDKKDSKDGKLDGTYTVVSGQRDGKEIPKSHFEKSVVVFEGNKVYGHDKDKKEFFGATYKIDTASKPWKLTMESTSPKKGQTAEGVIEVSGDTIRLAYSLPGGKAPTAFAAGEKQHLFTLKRVKKSDK